MHSFPSQRLRVRFIGAVALLPILLNANDIKVAIAEASNLPVTTQVWDGFGDDFDPHWVGDQQQVDWRRSYSSSGVILSSGSFERSISFSEVPLNDKPIELIRSRRMTSVDTRGRSVVPGDSAEAESKYSPTTKQKGIWDSQQARFARIIDLDDLTLAEGKAVAEQASDIADEYFSVEGRVATFSLIDLVEKTTSFATAAANSIFEADYRVNHPVSFHLSGSLSGWGNVDLDFLVRNNRTGELHHRLIPNDFSNGGLSYNFSVDGEFEPGSYKFYLAAHSASHVSSNGDYEPGDIGEFALDFSATSIGEFSAAALAVPEPTSLVLAMWLLPFRWRMWR